MEDYSNYPQESIAWWNDDGDYRGNLNSEDDFEWADYEEYEYEENGN